MIQPVNALDPRAGFRGSDISYGKAPRADYATKTKIAMVNAGGIAATIGGVTTAVSRNYTKSWGHAGVLGMFGAFLTLFFMTPQILASSSASKKNMIAEEFAPKSKTAKVLDSAKEHLKPAKKRILFKQT